MTNHQVGNHIPFYNFGVCRRLEAGQVYEIIPIQKNVFCRHWHLTVVMSHVENWISRLLTTQAQSRHGEKHESVVISSPGFSPWYFRYFFPLFPVVDLWSSVIYMFWKLSSCILSHYAGPFLRLYCPPSLLMGKQVLEMYLKTLNLGQQLQISKYYYFVACLGVVLRKLMFLFSKTGAVLKMWWHSKSSSIKKITASELLNPRQLHYHINENNLTNVARNILMVMIISHFWSNEEWRPWIHMKCLVWSLLEQPKYLGQVQERC